MPEYRCGQCGANYYGWATKDTCCPCGGKLVPAEKYEAREVEEHIIFVRDYLQTHIARSEGRTASATAGKYGETKMLLKLKARIIEEYRTQSRFAAACGKKEQWLTRILTGRQTPNPNELMLLVTKLGITDINKYFGVDAPTDGNHAG